MANLSLSNSRCFGQVEMRSPLRLVTQEIVESWIDNPRAISSARVGLFVALLTERILEAISEIDSIRLPQAIDSSPPWETIHPWFKSAVRMHARLFLQVKGAKKSVLKACQVFCNHPIGASIKEISD